MGDIEPKLLSGAAGMGWLLLGGTFSTEGITLWSEIPCSQQGARTAEGRQPGSAKSLHCQAHSGDLLGSCSFHLTAVLFYHKVWLRNKRLPVHWPKNFRFPFPCKDHELTFLICMVLSIYGTLVQVLEKQDLLLPSIIFSIS